MPAEPDPVVVTATAALPMDANWIGAPGRFTFAQVVPSLDDHTALFPAVSWVETTRPLPQADPAVTEMPSGKGTLSSPSVDAGSTLQARPSRDSHAVWAAFGSACAMARYPPDQLNTFAMPAGAPATACTLRPVQAVVETGGTVGPGVAVGVGVEVGAAEELDDALGVGDPPGVTGAGV